MHTNLLFIRSCVSSFISWSQPPIYFSPCTNNVVCCHRPFTLKGKGLAEPDSNNVVESTVSLLAT